MLRQLAYNLIPTSSRIETPDGRKSGLITFIFKAPSPISYPEKAALESLHKNTIRTIIQLVVNDSKSSSLVLSLSPMY